MQEGLPRVEKAPCWEVDVEGIRDRLLPYPEFDLDA